MEKCPGSIIISKSQSLLSQAQRLDPYCAPLYWRQPIIWLIIILDFSDAERHANAIEENKNKVESSLQDKLAARRQRRAMKNVEEKEKSVLV